MRISTRFLFASLLAAGLWTWSGAAVLCGSGIELSASPSCCPGECQCEPSSCGCSMAPTPSRTDKAEAPMVLPESLKESPKPGPEILPANFQAHASGEFHRVETADRSAWVATTTKHADALLDLFCVQLV